MIASGDADKSRAALNGVYRMQEVSDEVRDAVAAEAGEIAAAIREFNEMPADDPRFHDFRIDLPARFNTWAWAWWTVIQRRKLDGRPPMQEIFDLAQKRATDTSMSEIVENTKRILDALPAETSASP